ncbi:MAG: putative quinol monooxygenase [Dehalococcoidales bacterium]|nr:putative quinol monooxygenase [Dehalococcoidales bacterium]
MSTAPVISTVEEGATMYVVIAEAKVQQEHREEFVAALKEDARGSLADEPGVLRFEIIQDEADANRLYLVEVYRDKAAHSAHVQGKHFLRWRETVKDWYVEPLQAKRGTNLFPSDENWPARQG